MDEINVKRLRPLRPRRPPPDEDEDEDDHEKKTGKGTVFAGILDKCEPVDYAPASVVATFHAIKLFFTTEKKEGEEEEEKINMNDLDPIQLEELEGQLAEMTVSHTSIDYVFEAVMSESKVDNMRVGSWFQLEFEPSSVGNGSMVEIASFSGMLYAKDKETTVSFSNAQPLNEEMNISISKSLGLTEQSSSVLSRKLMVSTVHLPAAVPLEVVTKVKVMKVGQGNCNVLQNDAGVAQMAFDVGHDSSERIINNMLEIESCKTVVMSHWDYDHYNLLFPIHNIGVSTTGKTFIVPEQDSNLTRFIQNVNQLIRTTAQRVIYMPTDTDVASYLPNNVKIQMTTAHTGGRNSNSAIVCSVTDRHGIVTADSSTCPIC